MQIEAVDDEQDPRKVKISIKDTEGVEIRPFGATEGTNSFTKYGCASEGISNLLPFGEIFQIDGNGYFKEMVGGFLQA